MPIFYRCVIAVLACVTALLAHAGEPQSGIAGVADRKATVNCTDLARQEARAPLAPRTPKVVRSPMPGPKEPADRVSPARDRSTAAAPAEAGPAPLSPTPASSFLALADDTTAIPPDTHGAVGPNHLMTVLNTQVRIQNRTGVVLSTVSLDFFWASLGNPSAFDPKIFYDPYGGRWVFAASANSNSTASAVLIGGFQTSDPTGVWNLFRVEFAATPASVPSQNPPCTTTSPPPPLSVFSPTRKVPRWFPPRPTTRLRHWRPCISSMSSPAPPVRFASARSRAR